MVRAKHVLLLVAVAAIAVAVPIAQGTTSAKDPRVTKLIKQVNALKSQVSSLQSDVGTLKSNVATLTQAGTSLQADITCLKHGAVGVIARGKATNEGYLFKRANDDVNVYLYEALDVTAQGETADAIFPSLDPSCVKSFHTLAFRTAAGKERLSAYSHDR
jgi:hypothetical protein